MLELMVVSSKSGDAIQPDEAFTAALGGAADVPDRYRFSFSYVVDRSTMMPVEPILRYLTFSASTRSNSENTIRNKANACYELFLYLDAIAVDYRDICIETLIEYKERLAAFISAKTRRPLSAGTINARMQVAKEFCIYQKILSEAEITQLNSRPAARQTHIYFSGRGGGLHVKNNSTLVEYISTSDLGQLLATLGEPPRSGCVSRDWLLATFCVTTGARLSEALSLTVNQVLQAACNQTGRQTAKILLTKTKGCKPREIDVDRGLIDLLVKYIDEERKNAIAIGKSHQTHTRDNNILFVNGSDCAPRFSGKPYQAKRAEEYFAASQIKIGMTRIVPIYNLDTRETIGQREINRHTIHHLRHTYAIQAWNAYRSLPETDRWIRIQTQLGHRSHEVTANTYLRAVKHSEASGRDMLGAFYISLMAKP